MKLTLIFFDIRVVCVYEMGVVDSATVAVTLAPYVVSTHDTNTLIVFAVEQENKKARKKSDESTVQECSQTVVKSLFCCPTD